jgi:peptidoglycan/LPS O-acetylase OafA/YrhL
MSQRRLDYIDGLRALAALTVFLFHAWAFSGLPGNGKWNPLQFGYVGVHLFLVLSGFCIYWPFANGRQMTLGEFAKRRFRRIAPPYYAALVGFALIALLFNHLRWLWPESPSATLGSTLRQLTSHALFVHNLLPNHILAVAGPFWSIGLEVQLYLAMPLLAVVASKWGIKRAVLLAAITTLFYRGAVTRYVGGTQALATVDGETDYVMMSSFLARWVEFALGMWGADLVARQKPPQRRVGFGWLALVLIMAAMVNTRIFGRYAVVSDPLWGLAFLCVILHAAQAEGASSANLCYRLLCWKPLVGLGIMSYSLYLLHSPIIRWMIAAMSPRVTDPALLFLLCILIFAPLIILLSWMFFKVFEQPFLRSSRGRRTERPAPALVAPLVEVAQA